MRGKSKEEATGNKAQGGLVMIAGLHWTRSGSHGELGSQRGHLFNVLVFCSKVTLCT